MADAKKPGGKPPAKPSGDDSVTSPAFIFVMLLIFALVIVPSVVSFFGFSFGWFNENTWINVKAFTTELVSNVLTSISFLSIFCIFLFALGIYYAKLQKGNILEDYERKLKEKYEAPNQKPDFRSAQAPSSRPIERPLPHEVVSGFPGAEAAPLRETHHGIPQFGEAPAKQSTLNPRWEEVKRHIASHTPSEWRIAILEADILLYEMLDQMGYPGDSVAEKLKQVDKTSFHALDDAWRGHRVRNLIAHQGATYEISRYEAEKTIKLYQKVFEEFYFI